MLGILGGLFYFLIALGILVTIHELGHFLAAKACGVKVLRFSLGFGPVLFKKKGKDNCEYAVSAIPLGGYVKMEGENTPIEDRSSLPKGSYKSKKVWQRAIIIFAGPFFNLVLAVFLFSYINMSGITQLLPVVGDVKPESIAQTSGFKDYDLIESINGKNITSWKDVMYELVEVVGSTTPASVTVSSDLGNGQKRVLSLDASNIVLNRNESPIKKVGLEPCLGRIGTTLAMVEKGSPAQKASLKLGDEIAKINGIEMSSWYRIVDMIHDSNGAPLNLVVKRDGSLYQTTVVPENKYSEKTKMTVPYVGIAPEFKPIDGLRKTTRYGLVDALIKAVSDSASMAKLVLVSTYKLANGTISADNISGPIAIAQGAKESASFGFKIFISFLAAISVNLGILNLMPIPVLDGGQLLFLAYEAVMRKEPSARTQMILTSFGAAILLTMMIFAVFNDIKGF